MRNECNPTRKVVVDRELKNTYITMFILCRLLSCPSTYLETRHDHYRDRQPNNDAIKKIREP